MAVTSITEDFKGRRSSADEAGRTHVRVFYVYTDTFSDGTLIAVDGSAGGTTIPAVGEVHPVDSFATMREKNAEPLEDDPCAFRVTCTYTTRTRFAGINLSGAINPELIDNPLDVPPQISFGYTIEEEAMPKDLAGTPVVNSAKQAFDPPPTRQYPVTTMTVVRNQYSYAPGTAATFVSTVNSAIWNLPNSVEIAAGRAKCVGISAVGRYDGRQNYWQVTYEFHVRYEVWNPVLILDQGLAYRDGSNNLILATDSNGDKVTSPVGLNGTGGLLAAGGTPVYLEFEFFREQDFNTLGVFS